MECSKEFFWENVQTLLESSDDGIKIFQIFIYLVMNFGRLCHKGSLNRSSCGVHLRLGLKARIFFLKRLA